MQYSKNISINISINCVPCINLNTTRQIVQSKTHYTAIPHVVSAK